MKLRLLSTRARSLYTTARRRLAQTIPDPTHAPPTAIKAAPPPARLAHLNSLLSHADAVVASALLWPVSDALLHLPLHSPPKPAQSHYRLDSAAFGIPKHSPRPIPLPPADPLHLAVQVGEDAYFIRGNALGVADGVGGWPKPSPTQPTPSALFARRLMHHTAAQFDHEPPHLRTILDRAYERTINAHTTPAGEPLRTGSSTLLVAHLADSSVHLAQIGDSMAMLVRNTEIIWRSDEMWWAWNTPVQLAPPPTPRTTPRMLTVPVLPNDILILASDGLSDNLWDEDVLDEVTRFRHPSPNAIAEALCSRARSVSERRGNETPFARRARDVGKHFTGGKRDDISVLVAIVAPATR